MNGSRDEVYIVDKPNDDVVAPVYSGTGTLQLKTKSLGVVIAKDIGTIDYDTGKVSINSINITTVSNVDNATSTQIRLVVLPNSYDIVSVRNNLLEIDFANSTINGEIDGIASGSSAAGSTYSTTSSYS